MNLKYYNMKYSERLKERLSNLTQKELDEKWERLKHYNKVGPNAREYIEELNSFLSGNPLNKE